MTLYKFVFVSDMVLETLNLMVSTMWMLTILDFKATMTPKMTSKLKYNYSIWFVMLTLVENDTLFVFAADMVTEILNFMFSIEWMSAILDVKATVTPKMASKLKYNHSIVFFMLKLVENDTLFVFVVHMVLLILNLVF